MLLYLASGLDKGNLGNAKSIGMVGAEGLGADPTGKKYALLNGFYFIGYAMWRQSFFSRRDNADRQWSPPRYSPNVHGRTSS